MKKEEEVEVSDSVKRLLEFVEKHGGPSKVAQKLGKSPQIFYNYRKGASKPGTDVYQEIYQSYPDFDANYILFGKRPDVGPLIDEKELIHLREKLFLYQTIVKQMGVEPGKYRTVTLSPKIADLEGASEMLSNSVFLSVLGSRFGSQSFAL